MHTANRNVYLMSQISNVDGGVLGIVFWCISSRIILTFFRASFCSTNSTFTDLERS